MRVKVYKSLDEPSSIFGLKGSYFRILVLGAAAAAFLGIIVGKAVGGLAGLGVFLALLVADYLGVMAFQARFSERERKKWICSLKAPDFVSLQPRPFRDYLKVNFKEKKLEK